VALVRTDVSEEHIASITGVEGNSKLGTTLAVTSNCSTLQGTTDYIRNEAIEWDTRETGWAV
jgi:hypothetical protein